MNKKLFGSLNIEIACGIWLLLFIQWFDIVLLDSWILSACHKQKTKSQTQTFLSLCFIGDLCQNW